ncbi:hypothetical protein SAMN05216207_10977 [Pseudonocardia ammonioxydans]|uniref:Uncharacterized protein n=1 Tax=Pseudonocardia ammonioxydans TaxID=260086 RepID=A0A1I5IEW3_PSUAM|nr:hypothetical protein [Pseudonocardia ammonioxydans]SFO58621.1 hypothetical protein SAMN05216207_10977 [Pseudonocardia ammonioxydans]
MDLTAALLRFTARVPHVLIVGVPGHPELRLDVEEALRLRGWPEATGPADADVLIVAGRVGAELREVVDALWRQIPAPRVRVELTDDATSADLENTLATIPPQLADARHARREAVAAAASDPADDRATDDAGDGHEQHHSGHEHGGDEADEHDPGEHAAGGSGDGHAQRHDGHGEHAHDDGAGEHTGHDGHTDHDQHTPDGTRAADESEPGAHGEHDAGHGEHDGGHGGGHHDHHHMDMPLPGGLAMADVADDRDGLALDVLHVPLGPVLPEWPAGLVVDVALQGDVITSASARVLDAGAPRPPGRARVSAAVRDLDALARILAIAGWRGPATRARVLRDRLRRGDPVADLVPLVRTIRRSRLLRLMLRDVASSGGVDVADLLEQRLVRIEARAAGTPVDDPERPGPADLGARLTGAEFAAARLLVAALDPDVDGVVAATAIHAPGEDR